MGGGGVMRAAAKVAGITAAANHPVSAAARRAASIRPAAASTTATEDVKLVAQYLEVDDWVLAGGEEEAMFSGGGEPMPRVVFGGAPPTLQEAKEATSELTVALEKAYLSSPKSVGHKDSFTEDHNSSLSLSKSLNIETKACVTSDIVTAPAITAFRLLHESPMAQNVVASIASDPNVWTAVLKNQELQGFLQSQSAPCSNSDTPAKKDFDASSECGESEPASGFMDYFQKMKNTVVDMMSNLSGYFQNFFGGSKVFVNSDGTAKVGGDAVMGTSFMGLAIMAILVIMLKRA